MYKLKVKDNIFTIPKQNIRLLAITKAMDLKSNVELKTDEQAINYLKSIGIEIINTKAEIISELKAENEVLKQALNKEPLAQKALVTAYNGYKKQVLELYKVLDSYKQTLQEIKAIAKECTTCGDCFNCKYTEHCSTDIEAPQALGVCRMILKLITKAEEE